MRDGECDVESREERENGESKREERERRGIERERESKLKTRGERV